MYQICNLFIIYIVTDLLFLFCFVFFIYWLVKDVITCDAVPVIFHFQASRQSERWDNKNKTVIINSFAFWCTVNYVKDYGKNETVIIPRLASVELQITYGTLVLEKFEQNPVMIAHYIYFEQNEICVPGETDLETSLKHGNING